MTLFYRRLYILLWFCKLWTLNNSVIQVNVVCLTVFPASSTYDCEAKGVWKWLTQCSTALTFIQGLSIKMFTMFLMWNAYVGYVYINRGCFDPCWKSQVYWKQNWENVTFMWLSQMFSMWSSKHGDQLGGGTALNWKHSCSTQEQWISKYPRF